MIDVERGRDGRPLCMLQYMDMLSCCRIPGEEVDTQRRSPIDQSHHIIVAHNGHVSMVTVYHYGIIKVCTLLPKISLQKPIILIVSSALCLHLQLY